MPTVNIQDNPLIRFVGTKASLTTIITSQATFDFVEYQINDVGNDTSMLIDTRTTGDNIHKVSSTELKIVLKDRSKYKVRVRSRSSSVGGAWTNYSGWVSFTTRNKKYSTPDAITQLTDDTDKTVIYNGARTINVTNSALATVTFTGPTRAVKGTGATVVNLDPIHADVILQNVRGLPTKPEHGGTDRQPVRFTNKGATVIADDTVKYTPAGATITNF